MSDLILLMGAALVFMWVPALVGTAVLWQTLVMPKKAPMDESNRINHIRLVWFAVAHPQMFVSLFEITVDGTARVAFPWLRKDEQENAK